MHKKSIAFDLILLEQLFRINMEKHFSQFFSLLLAIFLFSASVLMFMYGGGLYDQAYSAVDYECLDLLNDSI